MYDLFLRIIKPTNLIALPTENPKRNENPRVMCIPRMQIMVSKYHSVVGTKRNQSS